MELPFLELKKALALLKPDGNFAFDIRELELVLQAVGETISESERELLSELDLGYDEVE